MGASDRALIDKFANDQNVERLRRLVGDHARTLADLEIAQTLLKEEELNTVAACIGSRRPTRTLRRRGSSRL